MLGRCYVTLAVSAVDDKTPTLRRAQEDEHAANRNGRLPEICVATLDGCSWPI